MEGMKMVGYVVKKLLDMAADVQGMTGREKFLYVSRKLWPLYVVPPLIFGTAGFISGLNDAKCRPDFPELDYHGKIGAAAAIFYEPCNLENTSYLDVTTPDGTKTQYTFRETWGNHTLNLETAVANFGNGPQPSPEDAKSQAGEYLTRIAAAKEAATSGN